MRRNISICLFFSLLLLSSCSNSIQIDTNDVVLHQDEIHQIQVPPLNNYKYESLNKFHAIVSTDGYIQGKYVGETDVRVYNKHAEEFIHVTVEPKYLLYTEPNIKFGESRSAVKARYGTPSQESNSAIIYNNYENGGFMLMVTFNQNNQVVSYVVMVPYGYVQQLAFFLNERYKSNGASNGKNFYINALTEEEASLFLTLVAYNEFYWMVLYEQEPNKA